MKIRTLKRRTVARCKRRPRWRKVWYASGDANFLRGDADSTRRFFAVLAS